MWGNFFFEGGEGALLFRDADVVPFAFEVD